MSKIQYLAIGMTALWTYDYFLTLKDEVTELYDDNGRKEHNHLIQVRYAWKTESVLSARTFGLFPKRPN